jgi:glycosyltransferase involved in cell wall biosynthesis
VAQVFIVGTRGVPNRYGGFERLVEVLAPYLVQCGHEVTVFCEPERPDSGIQFDTWHGVHRRFIQTSGGALGTLQYDFRSIRMVPRHSVVLLFGYGTALFQLRLKALGIPHAVNMDGIEWQRAKWGVVARAWLRLNEFIATRLADLLIADHPEIGNYLARRFGVESRMIAYGVDLGAGRDVAACHDVLDKYRNQPFFLVIARAEPENQIHVILEAYRLSKSPVPLVIVGNFDATPYGRGLKADNPAVDFVGAVYEEKVLNRLRSTASLYLHGHSVGGTNPSLIEAMAAGGVIVAHDNVFNRWVAGSGALYFSHSAALAGHFRNPPGESLRSALRSAAARSCEAQFSWGHVLQAYAVVVDELCAKTRMADAKV